MPLSDEKSFSLLKQSEFHLWFKKAEKAVKEVEYIHAELTMPAVNELRYAGYHISNYLEDTELLDELNRAVGHCKRATYDAYEASILYNIKEFRAFKEDYGTVVISEVLADYSHLHYRVTSILEFLRSIDKETKDQHYAACKQHHQELKDIIIRLDSAREELNKKIKIERKKSFVAIAGIAVAVLSSVIALLTYLGCN
ncbi:MAG: hypothetical protein WBP54_04660 [Pelodictyon phaeoclathratiforme]